MICLQTIPSPGMQSRCVLLVHCIVWPDGQALATAFVLYSVVSAWLDCKKSNVWSVLLVLFLLRRRVCCRRLCVGAVLVTNLVFSLLRDMSHVTYASWSHKQRYKHTNTHTSFGYYIRSSHSTSCLTCRIRAHGLCTDVPPALCWRDLWSLWWLCTWFFSAIPSPSHVSTVMSHHTFMSLSA